MGRLHRLGSERSWHGMEKYFPDGKMGGEHLECSPCGKVAGCALVNAWPSPEVLLSLLPKQPTIIA
jgi:hypothetical protein